MKLKFYKIFGYFKTRENSVVRRDVLQDTKTVRGTLARLLVADGPSCSNTHDHDIRTTISPSHLITGRYHNFTISVHLTRNQMGPEMAVPVHDLCNRNCVHIRSGAFVETLVSIVLYKKIVSNR